ncbi:MAG: O-antigen ligase family protein [Dehalococcoidia bacterium]|nr:O-antigen ligase family protein [Dehalococcoidia bacterium]
MRVLSQRLDPPEVSLPAAVVFALLIAASLIIALIPLNFAIAVVLGTIALTLVLVRVDFGIYLTIFAVPFGSLKEIPIGPASLSVTEFLIPLVFIGWVLKLIAQRDARVRFTPLFPFLVLFMAVLILSATISRDLALSTKELLKWTEFTLLFLVVANVMTGRRQIAAIVVLLLLATSMEAFHGWYQFLFRKGPDGFLIGGVFLRAFGTFGQPNPYAGYLGLTLPLLLGLLVGTRWNLSMRIDRGFVALMTGTIIILAALLMSFSRGALIALAIAFAVMLALRSRQPLVFLLTGILIISVFAFLAVLGLLPTEATNRLATLAEYFGLFDVTKVVLTPENWAIVERMAYWQSAWEMFKDHWIIGIGIGNFSAYYPEYAYPGWASGAMGHAHNYYLNLLAETGLPGFFAYIAFMVAVFIFALRTVARLETTDPPFCRTAPGGWNWFSQPYPLALGLMGVLVALSIHNFFDVLYVHGMAVQLGLILGLLFVLNAIPGEKGARDRTD